MQALRTGDCGPTAILLGSIYQSIGIPARVVFETKPTSEFAQHFYPEIYLNGQWVSADASEFLFLACVIIPIGSNGIVLTEPG